MEVNRLWPQGPFYTGESVQTDALLLWWFARDARVKRAADLCCGSGIVGLLLAWESEVLCVDAVDFYAPAIRAARANFTRNGLDGRCLCHEADLREAALEKGRYDLVVCNPPYFAPGAGKRSPDTARALAREESATPAQLCAAAAALLRPGGRFCVVYRPERLCELLAAMEGAGLAVKRLRCVSAAPESPPALLLCEGRRGAQRGLRMEPPLFLHGNDGRESAEYRRITHRQEDNT